MAKRRYNRPKKAPALKRKLAKPTLNPDLWIMNTNEVAQMREEVLSSNGGLCEMTGEPIKRPSLDHDHSDPPVVRGVISQHCNTMEGYLIKYFNKYCKHNTKLTLSEFLRKMADYFEKDWNRGLHHRAISDKQTKLCRTTNQELIDILINDYNHIPESGLLKDDLINLIIDFYIKDLERIYCQGL